MTAYSSNIIEIPGLEYSSTTAVAGVPKKSSESWADGVGVYFNCQTQQWEQSSTQDYLCIADGASGAGTTTANIKILPFLTFGPTAGMSDFQAGVSTNAQEAWCTGTNVFSTRVRLSISSPTPTGRAWPKRVQKVAGESWSLAQTIYRIDDPTSSDYLKYTATAGSNTNIGAAFVASPATETEGIVTLATLWLDEIEERTFGYESERFEVVKPSAESWALNDTIFVSGTSATRTATPGYTVIGRCAGTYGAGTTRAFVVPQPYRGVDPLPLALHFRRMDIWALRPSSTILSLGYKTEFNATGGTDTYTIRIREYKLVLPSVSRDPTVQGPSVAGASQRSWVGMPPMAIDFPASAIAVGGTWELTPADRAVVFWNTFGGERVVGQLYSRDSSFTATETTARPQRWRGLAGTHAGLIQGANGLESWTANQSANPAFSRAGVGSRLRVNATTSDTVGSLTYNVEESYGDPTVVGSDKTAWRTVGTASIPTVYTGGGQKHWSGSVTLPIAAEPWHFTTQYRLTPQVPSDILSTSTTWEDIGCAPFPFDVPQWTDYVQAALTTLVGAVPLVGRRVDVPSTTALTFSGGYTANLTLAGAKYNLSIVSTRHSAEPAGDDRFTKSTVWFAAIRRADTGEFLLDGTRGVWGKSFRRIQLVPPFDPTTTYDTWFDVAAFTAPDIAIAQRTGSDVQVHIRIWAVTSSTSRYYQSDRSVDRSLVTITLPSL